MAQSLAVKYRPTTLNEVVGQSTTIKILSKIIEKRSFKHTFCFYGPSGTGKTSLARCFANAINQGQGSPIEIDAASNNSVDDVRAITEAAKQRAVDAEYKIFIIDECHAISTQGWQAYLKSLEDTPPYTIYMFCTTEPHKIPEAVLNRMQRYAISKLSSEEITNRLRFICANEGFTNYDQACALIGSTALGCMRDAIMKLEQCADFDIDLSLENVQQVLATASFNAMFYLTAALQAKDETSILYAIDKLYNSGADLKQFIETYIEFVLDLSKYALLNNMAVVGLPYYLENEIKNLMITTADPKWYMSLVDSLLQIKLEIKYDSFFKSTIEAFLLRFCR